MDGTELDAGYWYANVRQRVRFADAVRALAQDGFGTFIEVSPHPVLEAAIADTLEEAGAEPPVISGTMHRESSGAAQILTALARLHVRGHAVDWAAVLGGGHPAELPTYAFQRQRYWPEPPQGPQLLAVGGDGAGTEAEARFWAAVEGGDVAGLAGALAVDGQQPFGQVVPALAAWRRREQDRSVTGGWRYRVAWMPVPDPDPAMLSGTWLVVAPAGTADGTLAQGCARALTTAGARVVVTEAGSDEADRAVLAGRISQALAGAQDAQDAGVSGVSGTVSLLGLDEGPVAGFEAVARGLAGTLALVQALGDVGAYAPLWVVTCGAVAAGDAEVLASPLQAEIWGLGRVAGLEHPDRWGGLIDVPPVLDERAAVRLCGVLAGRGEDQVAIRSAGIFGRRLVRAPLPAQDLGRWVPRGSVLITGGTGAIGTHVARWLAGRGAARVVLAGRSGPAAAGAAALAAELAGAGAGVDVVACDTGVREQVGGLLGWVGAGLSVVMHAAGVLDDGVLDRLDVSRLAGVLAAKAAGAAYLDELTAGMGLDAFVLFSSAAAVLGSAGQGNYGAANAFLDALALNRRGRGLPGTSVAWGPWAGGGVAQASDTVQERLRRGPLPEMDPHLAVKALGQVLAGGDGAVAVMDVEWARWAGADRVPFLRELPDVRELARQAGEGGPGAGGEELEGGLARRLAGVPAGEQLRVLTELVREVAAGVLGHASAEPIGPDRAFSELGFDSLTALEMRQAMNTVTGLRLPATLLFDYPTAVVLAGYLRGELLGEAAADVTASPVTTEVAGEPVVIVAMGCRYPGGVQDPEGLWELVAAGTDAISGFPQDRGWDTEGLFDPDPGHQRTSYVRGGGFVHEATEFDPGFFGISPREALAMDPQQRLLLEVCWEALERVGIDPVSLRGSRTGVFVGGYSSGYDVAVHLGQEDASGLEGHLLTGTATSVISGRVSYALGLEGPAVTVDTACSSSLVTLHLAAQALRSGECDLALAGGVTIMATPGELVGFSQQRGLAADGRCKAFGASADGMGMAEGAGMVVVERLADARRNGHRVLAVVAGSAVNQDGA
ncbi:MAG TPA: beta-ketoacyl synthase N-terminal-like domain-containing protein, partial [Streptosporangiaceae bacterium]|nr:beta-ketoacyl synthase N-terminal-like domain-containing protein [Streptosporangiaceae bacterium]